MQGKIWLRSNAGIGSTFYVSIPFVQKPINNETGKKVKKEEVSTIEQVHPSPKTILVAEDDESNFYFLNELLVNLKYTVLRARNGLEAVEICKTNQSVDMVFMDIKMPVMDGFEATKQIKALNPKIPIIAQTAFAMADDQHTVIEKGCDDYLSKPIDPEILLSKIKKHLQA